MKVSSDGQAARQKGEPYPAVLRYGQLSVMAHVNWQSTSGQLLRSGKGDSGRAAAAVLSSSSAHSWGNGIELASRSRGHTAGYLIGHM